MGCPTSYEGKTLTWSKGRLASMRKGTIATGAQSYVYTYNGFGQRIARSYSKLANASTNLQDGELKTSSKQCYYDHAGRLVAETGSKTYYNEGIDTEQIVYLYDESGIIGMEYQLNGATATYYFHRNLLGDVLGIYDTSGTLVAKYIYDAWGNCTISGETTNNALAHANPIRYRGYYYDDDTGLYYCNARYYSPKWRRFISPDDTAYLDPEAVNGLNLYCYCNNDPVNFIDPSGHSVSPIAIAISNIVKGKLQFPSTNFVEMAHCTTSVQSNRIIGGLFWNLSYTVTTQKDNAETFYAYGNIGNSGVSYGGGVNLGDWFGASGYISSNIGIGANVQLTPWVTAGAEVSLLNGISVSAGLILGNTTHEISVNVGWGTIAGAFVLASIPLPGTKIAACVLALIDIFV